MTPTQNLVKLKLVTFQGRLIMQLSSKEQIEAILQLTSNPFQSVAVTFVNPTNFYEIQENQLHAEFDWIFSDGQFLTVLERYLGGHRHLKRASFDFTSLAHPVFRYCADKGINVALIGATSDEIAKSADGIKERFPKLRITFVHHGFFSENEQLRVLNKLQKSTVVIVGLGFPLQDIFSLAIKKHYPHNKLIFTCGGFLSQTAMKKQYYPYLADLLHLRWVVRFIRHQHVRQKIINDYPKFLKKYASDYLQHRLGK